ncbi:MAG: GCAxxG family protein [Herbinix sp.]|jgi:C_GCAxxG_C_C family probable redox protein|nr:GCAxxG family protein [Herbinix sp.]
MGSRVGIAEELFQEGFNCSQSVFAAYSDLYGIDRDTALRLGSSFGGGLGRMREVCGAVSGMSMLAGLATGSVVGGDMEGKQKNYELVQQMAEEFMKISGGSIICRDLLGVDKDGNIIRTPEKDPTRKTPMDTKPEERSQSYYENRPCAKLVKEAAEIIERMLLTVDFEEADTDDKIKAIAELATAIWHEHFVTIISEDQINYMVEKFQSIKAITEQIQEAGYQYYQMKIPEGLAGYFAIRKDPEALFLSKLYIEKKYRGRGYAKKAILFMMDYCKKNSLNKIWLTVNRYNETTIHIYKNLGFEITELKVADIGSGFVMDDYIMELQVTK